jgi:hypothetical protein
MCDTVSSPSFFPRWFWPVVIVSAIWIAVMALWFPVANPGVVDPHANCDHGCDHD